MMFALCSYRIIACSLSARCFSDRVARRVEPSVTLDVLRCIDKPMLENKVGRNIFYIIGVIVVVIAVLSLVGLA